MADMEREFMSTAGKKGGLGEFLRAKRGVLLPGEVGLPQREKRRTPGLRRQEVAELAGIGVDWYVRLEQGKAVRPSNQTLDALSKALRLTRAESKHLRKLAEGPEGHVFEREKVTDALKRAIDLISTPAYVIGRRWDVLAWNQEASDLFIEFSSLAAQDRNILVYMFLKTEAKKLFGPGWEREAKRLLAQFRGSFDFYSDTEEFKTLIARLENESSEFRTWWKRHEIQSRSSGQKIFFHPKRKRVRFEYVNFHMSEDPGLRLTIYTETK